MSRRDIYYWKCDRPDAFHGTEARRSINSQIEPQLLRELCARFPGERIRLEPANTQGNHLAWKGGVGETAIFVRVEDGADSDDHLEMESVVMDAVRATGVPVPKVLAVDASRAKVPFAWQALELISFPDLNHWHKLGALDPHRVAFQIGAAVARWQSVRPLGFGPLELTRWRRDRSMAGFHSSYESYFRLRLAHHLDFLAQRRFLSSVQRREIEEVIAAHQDLLGIDRGCLVHKDLALWNILGSECEVAAFIDFDDAISGDPMDDLSLLACFHDGAFLKRAIEGYESIRALPPDHGRRLWLHLLRNMIVKSVIRVGAGYFERSDAFFLIGTGGSGTELEKFTRERIALAIRGLQTHAGLELLNG